MFSPKLARLGKGRGRTGGLGRGRKDRGRGRKDRGRRRKDRGKVGKTRVRKEIEAEDWGGQEEGKDRGERTGGGEEEHRKERKDRLTKGQRGK